jgi:hypothetical protein
VPPACPPTRTLKETVLGAIAISGFFEFAVPFKVIGTELEYLATLFVVLTIMSLDNKPTVEGPKVAFRLNVWPAVRVKGVVTAAILKFALPVNATLFTVRPMLALQVMVIGADTLPMAVFANVYGEEQLRGRLTGEPKA